MSSLSTINESAHSPTPCTCTDPTLKEEDCPSHMRGHKLIEINSTTRWKILPENRIRITTIANVSKIPITHSLKIANDEQAQQFASKLSRYTFAKIPRSFISKLISCIKQVAYLALLFDDKDKRHQFTTLCETLKIFRNLGFNYLNDESDEGKRALELLKGRGLNHLINHSKQTTASLVVIFACHFQGSKKEKQRLELQDKIRTVFDQTNDSRRGLDNNVDDFTSLKVPKSFFEKSFKPDRRTPVPICPASPTEDRVVTPNFERIATPPRIATPLRIAISNGERTMTPPQVKTPTVDE